DRTAVSVLSGMIIAFPVILTVLIAASNRFARGNKWLLLRAAAEAVKREIFRYRARAGDYRPGPGRDGVLMQRIEDITRRLSGTEANSCPLRPWTGSIPPKKRITDPGDDGLKPLTPERYLEVRLEDQLAFYRRNTIRLERQSAAAQWAIIIIGS